MGGRHHKEEDPCGTQIAFVSPSLVFTHFEKSLTGSDFILVNMTVIFFSEQEALLSNVLFKHKMEERELFSEKYRYVGNYQMRIKQSPGKMTRFNGF